MLTVSHQSQEYGASSSSPPWMVVTQILEPPTTTFPDTVAGSWIRSGIARFWNCAHMGCLKHQQWRNLLHHNAGPFITRPNGHRINFTSSVPDVLLSFLCIMLNKALNDFEITLSFSKRFFFNSQIPAKPPYKVERKIVCQSYNSKRNQIRH